MPASANIYYGHTTHEPLMPAAPVSGRISVCCGLIGVSIDRTKDSVWHDHDENGETVRSRLTERHGNGVRPDEYPPFWERAAPGGEGRNLTEATLRPFLH